MKKRRISLSLRAKLLLLMSLPILMYAGSNVYILSKYGADMSNANALFEQTNEITTNVLNADRDLYQSLSAYQLLKSGGMSQDRASLAQEDMLANVKQASERLQKAEEIANSAGMMELKKSDGDTTVQEIIASFRENFKVWVDDLGSSLAVSDGTAPNEDFMNRFIELRGSLNTIGEILEEYAGAQSELSKKQLEDFKLQSYIGIAACVIAIGVVSFFIIRNLYRVVGYMISLTRAVADGDLRPRPAFKRGNDELGKIADSIETMASSLRGLIGTISENADHVSASSKQMQLTSKQSTEAASSVAVDIQSVSDGMESQTRGAEESARAIVEMAVGIARVAENTSSISEYSTATSQKAEQGQQQIDLLVSQMQGIKSVIQSLSGIVDSLNERSREIGQIAEQITSFSNQTNILSLNASIEAARAGEHGRGFTVVAGEIRNLAAASLQSATTINELVAATQGEVASATGVMTKTLTEVEQGSKLLANVTESFTQIRGSIESIASQIHDNSAITEQMSASSEQVSATMEQSAHTAQLTLDSTRSVAAATEEQLALMEDITSAADQLQRIVSQLTESVTSFKVK
ncbi:methyl-accepting chemotaxis protein [Paenibacillus methanolicus]|uniref:Methyl-accepting chemotaxis protein n=1 Tax=Paenibacillus methanolicus TaxID=582686 RepID=A0A5S5CEW4_9BACL|nr:methyl-accepting chemotaxis protein [Paenibacillus methanolicus]TYP77925.1 methyl-accepting chemotaxis protein [Paenibacillus methanolicus]